MATIEKEPDLCEGCKKPRKKVGVIRLREQIGINKYLCSMCCHRALGDYDKICRKCLKNNYDGSFEMKSYYGNDMCADCIEKEEQKRKRREAIKLKIRNYFKLNHWKIIFAAIGVAGIIVGILNLVK